MTTKVSGEKSKVTFDPKEHLRNKNYGSQEYIKNESKFHKLAFTGKLPKNLREQYNMKRNYTSTAWLTFSNITLIFCIILVLYLFPWLTNNLDGSRNLESTKPDTGILKLYIPSQTYVENSFDIILDILNTLVPETEEPNPTYVKLQKLKAEEAFYNVFKNHCYNGDAAKILLPDGKPFQMNIYPCDGIEFAVNVTLLQPSTVTEVVLFASFDNSDFWVAGISRENTPLGVNKNVTFTGCGGKSNYYYLVACGVKSEFMGTFKPSDRLFSDPNWAFCSAIDTYCGPICGGSPINDYLPECTGNQIQFDESVFFHVFVLNITIFSASFSFFLFLSVILTLQLFGPLLSNEHKQRKYKDIIPKANYKQIEKQNKSIDDNYKQVKQSEEFEMLASDFDEENDNHVEVVEEDLESYLDTQVNYREGYDLIKGKSGITPPKETDNLVGKTNQKHDKKQYNNDSATLQENLVIEDDFSSSKKMVNTVLAFQNNDYNFVRSSTNIIINSFSVLSYRGMNGCAILALDDCDEGKYKIIIRFVHKFVEYEKIYGLQTMKIFANTLFYSQSEEEFHIKNTSSNCTKIYNGLVDWGNSFPSVNKQNMEEQRQEGYKVNTTDFKNNFSIKVIQPTTPKTNSTKRSKVSLTCLKIIFFWILLVLYFIKRVREKISGRKEIHVAPNGVGKGAILEFSRIEIVNYVTPNLHITKKNTFLSVVDVRHAVSSLFYIYSLNAFYNENGDRKDKHRGHQISHMYEIDSPKDFMGRNQRDFFLYINFLKNQVGMVTSSGNGTTIHLGDYSDGTVFDLKCFTLTEDLEISIRFISKNETMSSSSQKGSMLSIPKKGFGFIDSENRWKIGSGENIHDNKASYWPLFSITTLIAIGLLIASIAIFNLFDSASFIVYYVLISIYIVLWFVLLTKSIHFQSYNVIFVALTYHLVGGLTGIYWNVLLPISFVFAPEQMNLNSLILLLMFITMTSMQYFLEFLIRNYQKKDGPKHGHVISEADHMNSFRMFIIECVPNFFATIVALFNWCTDSQSWSYKFYEAIYFLWVPAQQILYLLIIVYVPVNIVFAIRSGSYVFSNNISDIFGWILSVTYFVVSFPAAYALFLSLFCQDIKQYLFSPRIFSSLIIIALSLAILAIFYNDVSFFAIG